MRGVGAVGEIAAIWATGPDGTTTTVVATTEDHVPAEHRTSNDTECVPTDRADVVHCDDVEIVPSMLLFQRYPTTECVASVP